MKNSANLDLLRSIAVMLVVFSHLGVPLGLWDRESLSFVGLSGVVIFFVHTCLVLMHSLERHGTAPLPFFVRRAFRIYPLAVAMVLFIAAGKWLGGHHVEPGQVLSNMLLVQNLTGHESDPYPLWSLPYEVQMYLVLPPLFLIATKGGTRLVGLLWAATVAALLSAMSVDIDMTLLQWTPCFLAGVLAFTLPKHTRHPALLFIVLGAGLGLAVCANAAGLPRPLVFWLLALAVGITVPQCRDMTAGWLSRFGAVIAKYSYGIYVTHLFAVNFPFLLLHGLPLWSQLVIFVLVLAAFARVAYRWIEAPGIAFGVQLAQNVMKKPPRAVPATPGEPAERSVSGF